MKATSEHWIGHDGRRVDYRLVRSATARGLRVRVGPNGVEVVQPVARHGNEVAAFLGNNEAWILDQIRRVERLRDVRRKAKCSTGELLFRGKPTRVRINATAAQARGNTVSFTDGAIVIERGTGSRTPIARSLENWLRKQARAEVEKHLSVITARLRRHPGRVYVMGQRTKWGNCSTQKNLSFNWRLIFAPDYVLRYVVVHEAVHLAIPDHSQKFWLAVQSLSKDTTEAKQWLRAHSHEMNADWIGIVFKAMSSSS